MNIILTILKLATISIIAAAVGVGIIDLVELITSR